MVYITSRSNSLCLPVGPVRWLRLPSGGSVSLIRCDPTSFFFFFFYAGVNRHSASVALSWSQYQRWADAEQMQRKNPTSPLRQIGRVERKISGRKWWGKERCVSCLSTLCFSRGFVAVREEDVEIKPRRVDPTKQRRLEGQR